MAWLPFQKFPRPLVKSYGWHFDVLRTRTLLFSRTIDIYNKGRASLPNYSIGPQPLLWRPKLLLKHSSNALQKNSIHQYLKVKSFFGGGLYVFLNPTSLPEAPEARPNVQQIYSLSSLPYKRVTRASAITNTFPLPPVTQGTGRCDLVPGKV